MACSSMAFFMFAYQVHEKSVLLPVLPVALLAPHLPHPAAWLPPLAAFSMFPLLKRDGLQVAYFAFLLFWSAFTTLSWDTGDEVSAEQCPARGSKSTMSPRLVISSGKALKKARRVTVAPHYTEMPKLYRDAATALSILALTVAASVHVITAITLPPQNLPYLHDAAFTCSSFVLLLLIMMRLNVFAVFSRFS